MVTKLNRKETESQFNARVQKAANDFISGWHANRGLLQNISIEVFEHIEEHGNIMVFEPLVTAADAMPTNMRNKYFAWVENFTWLRQFRNVNGRTLSPRADAYKKSTFNKLWHKDSDGKMNIVGAKAKNWYDFTRPSQKGQAQAPVNVADKVTRFVQSLADALRNNRTVDAKGKRMLRESIIKMVDEALEKNLVNPEAKAGRVTELKPSAKRPVQAKKAAKAEPATEAKAA